MNKVIFGSHCVSAAVGDLHRCSRTVDDCVQASTICRRFILLSGPNKDSDGMYSMYGNLTSLCLARQDTKRRS